MNKSIIMNGISIEKILSSQFVSDHRLRSPRKDSFLLNGMMN
jgi:hypothetical protein